MLTLLVSEYPITSNKVLAERLGVCINSMRNKALTLGLTKAGRINYHAYNKVEKLFYNHSQKQIANSVGISVRTVRRICKALNLKRDKDEESVLRSEGIKRVIKSDNRRILYGLEQESNRCLGKSKERLKVYEELKKHGYIVIKGSRVVYYSSEMMRYVHVESYAKAFGLILEEWNSE